MTDCKNDLIISKFSFSKYPPISKSEDRSLKPFSYGSGLFPSTLSLEVIAKHVWSPVIFKGGKRTNANFEYAAWGALDFDDGLYTLEQAKREWCDTIHIIGTTRSHQISKNGLICDRFRIIFIWDKIITHSNDYRHNIKLLIDKYNADPACSDPARFFFPCSEIVSFSNEGFAQEIKKTDKPKFSQREIDEKYAQYKENGYIPAWIKGLLNYGCQEGERNKSVLRLGIYLTKLGKSEEEIVAMIARSPIKANDFDENEIKRAVSNGAKIAKKQRIKEE